MKFGDNCARLVCTTFVLAVAAGSLSKTANAQAPLPVHSFEALAANSHQINLYWLKSASATGYRIERDGAPLATLGAGAEHYEDGSVSPDSTHRYSIEATFGSLSSAPRTYVERSFAAWPKHKGKSIPIVNFDVVVAQASSGGVSAAIEAARRGLKVALIEPTTRLGGMPSNGLSATDLRRGEHASGFFIRFRDRVKSLYAAEGIRADGLSYEPRVANQAMKSLLYEPAGITLYRRARPVSVQKHESEAGGTIVDAVTIEEIDASAKPTGLRARLEAKVFIDSTDCGDIAAWAGAPFRLGREARSKREPHNGMIYYDRANDRPLPGSTGRGDHRIQAYSYLLTVKDYGAGTDKTIPKPAGYRKEDFVHTPEWLKSWAVTSGTMPGKKMELNQHPQGGDIQGINYRYPLENYTERSRLERLHRDKVLGYLYYIQTEQKQKQIGLPDDEYRDSGGFPPLLYVREGRRILGDELLDETDITDARIVAHPDSVGLGDYPMDSHAVRKKTNWSTPDMGEGEWWLYKQTPVHQLPLGVMVPKTLNNVYVTTAVSSTHVSFGTYRLEPVRMAFGQAAGIGADLCIRYGLNVHDVPARQIQDELLPHAANLLGDAGVRLAYYTDLDPTAAWYRPIEYLAARGIGFGGDQFLPDAPVTGKELTRLLQMVASRAVQGPIGSIPTSRLAYLGMPADEKTLAALPTLIKPDDSVRRIDLARILTRLFPYQVEARKAKIRHYADTPDDDLRQPADGLYSIGIDSVLWDGVKALAPDGKLYFRPTEPITRCQLFAALYLVQIDLGPAFDDHPVDRYNPGYRMKP